MEGEDILPVYEASPHELMATITELERMAKDFGKSARRL